MPGGVRFPLYQLDFGPSILFAKKFAACTACNAIPSTRTATLLPRMWPSTRWRGFETWKNGIPRGAVSGICPGGGLGFPLYRMNLGLSTLFCEKFACTAIPCTRWRFSRHGKMKTPGMPLLDLGPGGVRVLFVPDGLRAVNLFRKIRRCKSYLIAFFTVLKEYGNQPDKGRACNHCPRRLIVQHRPRTSDNAHKTNNQCANLT